MALKEINKKIGKNSKKIPNVVISAKIVRNAPIERRH